MARWRRNPKGKRFLFSGSRNWSDEAPVREIIFALPPGSTVVHGGAKGLDSIAGKLAKERGLKVEAHPVHPAEWTRLGKSAGPARNQRMVDLGADVVYAFPLPGSKGTRVLIEQATTAGLQVIVHGERPQRAPDKKRAIPKPVKGSAPSIYAVPVNPLMLSRAEGLLSSPEAAQIFGGKTRALGVLDPDGKVLKSVGVHPIPRAQFEKAVEKLKKAMSLNMGQLRLSPQLAKVNWPVVKIGTFKGQPVYLVSTGNVHQYLGLQLTGSPINIDIKRGLLVDRVLLKLALQNAPPSKAEIGLFLPEEMLDKHGKNVFHSESFFHFLRQGLVEAIGKEPLRDREELAAREGRGEVLSVQKIIPAESFAGALSSEMGQLAEDRLEHRVKIVENIAGGVSAREAIAIAQEYDSYPKLVSYLTSAEFEDLLQSKDVPPLDSDTISKIRRHAKEGDNFFTVKALASDPKEWVKMKRKIFPRGDFVARPSGDPIPRSSVEKISVALVGQQPGESMWNSPPTLLSLTVKSMAQIPKSPSYVSDVATPLVEQYDKDENGKLNKRYLNRGEPFVSILAVVKENRATRKIPGVKRADFLPGSETKKLVFISNIDETNAYVEPKSSKEILSLLNFVHGQRVTADGTFVSKTAPFPFSFDELAKIPWVKRVVEEKGAKLHDAGMAYLRMVFQPTFEADEARAGREAHRAFGLEGARGRRGASGVIPKTPRHVILGMPVSFKKWLPVTVSIMKQEELWPDLIGSSAEIREDMVNKALEVYGIGRLTGNRKVKLQKLERLKEILEAEEITPDEIQPAVRRQRPTEEEDWEEYESFSSQLNPKNGRRPRKPRKPRRARRSRYNPEAVYGVNIQDYLGDPTKKGELVGLTEKDVIDWTRTPNLFPTSDAWLPSGVTQEELSPERVAKRAQDYPLVRFGERAPVSTIEAKEIEAREQEGLSREEFANIISGMEKSRKSRNKSTIPASSSMCKMYRRQKLPGYRISPALAKAGEPGFQLRKVVLWMAPEDADNRVMMIRRNSHIDCDFVPTGRESTPGQVLSMAMQDVLLWLGQKAKRRKDTFVYVGRVGDPKLELLWRPENSLDMKSMITNLQLGSSFTMEDYEAEEDEENYYRALERAGFALPPESEAPIFEEEVEEEVEGEE